MQSRFSALLLGDREDPRLRLAALFGSEAPRAGQPPQPALEWAREVLAGHPSTVSEVEAVRLLRAAEPRLLLKPAQLLARHAVHG